MISHLNEEYNRNCENVDILLKALVFQSEIIDYLQPDQKEILKLTKGISIDVIREFVQQMKDQESTDPELEPKANNEPSGNREDEPFQSEGQETGSDTGEDAKTNNHPPDTHTSNDSSGKTNGTRAGSSHEERGKI